MAFRFLLNEEDFLLKTMLKLSSIRCLFQRKKSTNVVAVIADKFQAENVSLI